jgi:filamentous hemagglutinin family protein
MGVTLGANAQVVVDSSFGSGGALNGPNFQIPDNLGKTVGDNLFHSFTEFSLQTSQSATFTGPDSIQNILGRVTGSKISEIDGLIKSEITGANLYLLNPKGFLFGENAKVDVDGAFTVSARESIRLGEEGSFNAVNPDQSVFTSVAPNAFGFLGDNPGGAIRFSGSKLIVGNPMGLVGGDIKLEDSVIYSKSEGKPTGVRIEGNNLDIVDSQIRNKTISEDDQYQGISIELTGGLTITDTTISEQLDSGIDRGDFIEEIESDLPFSNKVGVLGLAEGLSETDPISIKAKSSRITGGGVYSVNLVPPDKLFDPSKSSNIEMEVDAFEINHGALENLTKFDNAVHAETIILEKTTGVIRPKEFPYPVVESVEVYLEGKRVFEGVDYTLRFNNRGKLLFVNFIEKLPKGSNLELITRPKVSVSPTNISLSVAGETKMGNESLLKASNVSVDTGGLLMDNSRVEGEYSIGINSAGSVSMDNESLMRSDYVEQGRISLASSDFLMQGNSRLVGSSKIEVEAKNKAVIRDDSSLVVGWEDAPVIPDERYKIYWDSKTGEVVDQFGELYPRKFKKSSLVASYLRGVYGAPEGTFSVININQPYNYKTIPHIHISANEAAVEDGVFDSRSGRNPSGLRIDSVDAIWLSGGSEINGFAQVELTADTVEMLKGVVYHSAIDVSAGDQNLAGVPGALIIRSGRLTDLRGQSLNGIVVVYSGDDIKVTDTNIGGYHEVNEASTTMLKLDAGGDLTIGTGELGISPYIEAYRVNLYGDNVHVKRTGIKSDMDVGILAQIKLK